MDDFKNFLRTAFVVILIISAVVGVFVLAANTLKDDRAEIETHVDPYWNIVCKTINDESFCFAMEDLNVDY